MVDDLEIVRRFQKGDTEAFSHLVQKYKKPIINLIYRYTGQAQQAEDLAQEVFLRAFKGLRNFKAKAAFFTWLYRIAINLAIRTRQRDKKFTFSSIEARTEGGTELTEENPSGAPQHQLEKQELREVVQSAILNLPADQRTVVILYRYENLSYEDIAKTLEISVGAVKSRLHRARLALKESLGPYVGQ